MACYRFPIDGYPWWKATAHVAGAYFFTGNSVLNQVLWTMRTEFFGSIVIFFVSWIFYVPRTRLYIYMALAVITISLRNFKEILYFAPFLAGSIMRESKLNNPSIGPKIAWLLFLMGSILGGTPYTDPTGTLYEPLANIVGTFHQHPLEIMKVAGAILLVFSIISIKINFFETWFATWLGKLSFSSYLIHLLVLVSLTSFLFNRLGQEYLIIQALIYLISVWVLASVFYRFIEAPAITWSRKIRKY